MESSVLAQLQMASRLGSPLLFYKTITLSTFVPYIIAMSVSMHSNSIKTCTSHSSSAMQLASTSADKTVRIWDLRLETQVAVLRGHSGIFNTVSFSPNGLLLASGSVRLCVSARYCVSGPGHMETRGTR